MHRHAQFRAQYKLPPTLAVQPYRTTGSIQQVANNSQRPFCNRFVEVGGKPADHLLPFYPIVIFEGEEIFIDQQPDPGPYRAGTNGCGDIAANPLKATTIASAVEFVPP